jgi:DivIVA domain-containing protein
MTDEAFRLTPLDIRRYDFGSALRGYDKTRVDQFRDQVAEEVERLLRREQDIEAKAKGFHEQLRAYRERDKALNEALITAQQLRSEMREQAEREAQLILREARAEAEKTVEGLRQDARRVQDEIDQLVRTRRTYLAQLRALVEKQLVDIDAAANVTMPKTSPPIGAMSADGADATHPTPAWVDSLMKE